MNLKKACLAMQWIMQETGKKRRISSYAGRAVLWLALLLMTAWGVAAIWFTHPAPSYRLITVLLYSAGSLLPPLLLRPRWAGWSLSGVVIALGIVWFLSLRPANNRDWQPDLAVLPWAEVSENTIVLHNIRNCDYRTENDFVCGYYDRTFDLAELTAVDLFLVYWGSPHIAHTMLSFGFANGGNVCFSIETRKEKGEDYSAVKGFFRQYEKIYVVADERDVVRLRTNFRHEDVFLYRLRVAPDMARKVFLDYLREVNRLKEQPQWYNALIGNCTTSIRRHTLPYNPEARLDWRLIVNGYIDEMIYERGILSQDLSFAELRKRSFINPQAQSADQAPDFSRRIRQGLPEISM